MLNPGWQGWFRGGWAVRRVLDRTDLEGTQRLGEQHSVDLTLVARTSEIVPSEVVAWLEMEQPEACALGIGRQLPVVPALAGPAAAAHCRFQQWWLSGCTVPALNSCRARRHV